MKIKGRIIRASRTALAFALLCAAFGCVWLRAADFFASDNAAIAAAAFTLADGEYSFESEGPPQTTQKATSPPRKSQTVAKQLKTSGVRDKSDYYDSFADHSGEAVYSIVEKTLGPDGTAVGNCYVKNRTGLDYDFEGFLNQPLSFEVKKKNDSPQVLIYHTHTTEAFMDEDVDYFYESYYSRTQDENFNVVAVGDAIAQTLEEKGIKALHDKTVHDSTYNGSYDRSAQTVYSDMDENPGIKVVLDIHRDALGTEDFKVKPVFYANGKKAAQIMILSGCDEYDERDFDHWKNNLSFALKLQNTAETMYPGMTRPLSFDFFAYNEYICDGSLLIEIGTDANSIDEVEYTGQLLGEVLAKVLGAK